MSWKLFFKCFVVFFILLPFHDALSQAGEKLSLKEQKAAEEAKALSKMNSILEISAKVDEFVNKGLAKNNVAPFKMVSDEKFLRRVYVDIMGRIPTYDEVKAFRSVGGKTKRYDLIEQLLDSEGYVSNNFNYWADLLRLTGGAPSPYVNWLKDALRNNTPYDEMTTELIASKGYYYEEGNGATGYYIRDMEMLEENMANTVRIFLGTRLACAQCHDHPFDKWTRRQYYEMTAFTSGIKIDRNVFRKKAQAAVGKTDLGIITQRLIVRAVGNMSSLVADQGGSSTNLPRDYQYDDASPRQSVAAKMLFGEAILTETGSPRDRYAKWLTSPQNPRFTMVIANRLWKKVMGLGLIEPADDIKDDTVASDPELFTFLMEEIIRQKYDMKKYLSILYNTQLYQREALPGDLDLEKAYYFPGPVRGRMSAEQIWDSIVTLSVPSVDFVKLQEHDYKNVLKKLKKDPEFVIQSVIDDFRLNDLRKASRKQRRLADKLRYERASQERIKKAEAEANKLEDEVKKIEAAKKELRKNSSASEGSSDEGSSAEEGKKKKKKKKKSSSRSTRKKRAKMEMLDRSKYPANWARASELTSPAPYGHFLRVLGQSDRDLIDNASNAPSIPQVLSFYNGFIDEQILKPHSLILKQLASLRTGQIDYIYTSILTRRPTSKERRWVKKELSGSGNAKYMDLIWILLNSHEFMAKD